MAGGRQRENICKPQTTCFFFLCNPKYTVGGVLTFPVEGSAFGRLGVGVQELGSLGWHFQLNIMHIIYLFINVVNEIITMCVIIFLRKSCILLIKRHQRFFLYSRAVVFNLLYAVTHHDAVISNHKIIFALSS